MARTFFGLVMRRTLLAGPNLKPLNPRFRLTRICSVGFLAIGALRCERVFEGSRLATVSR
jgi:hypothetical protein